jgi:hypothetical protein
MTDPDGYYLKCLATVLDGILLETARDAQDRSEAFSTLEDARHLFDSFTAAMGDVIAAKSYRSNTANPSSV